MLKGYSIARKKGQGERGSKNLDSLELYNWSQEDWS